MLSRTVIMYWLMLGYFGRKAHNYCLLRKVMMEICLACDLSRTRKEIEKHFIKERAKCIVSSVLSLRLYFYA